MTGAIGMNGLTRRIGRLEANLVPQEDLATLRTAEILRERFRRCAEALGEPFEELPPAPVVRGPRLSPAETLRLRFTPEWKESS
jgi:hypothetical protein